MVLGIYQTNCYLIRKGNDLLVIDPGSSPRRVIEAVRELEGCALKAVLLTHGHFDHVGGVKGIAEVTGCPAYLHENELSLPEGFTAGPLYYTDTYGEGDVLSLAGISLRVLHTPGHTPGSVCLAAEDILFSGDTLFMDSIGRTDFPGGSIAQMGKSLKRLADLPVNYRVLPGHGSETTLNAERQYNPYLQ